jgi:hypothetical protein
MLYEQGCTNHGLQIRLAGAKTNRDGRDFAASTSLVNWGLSAARSRVAPFNAC